MTCVRDISMLSSWKSWNVQGRRGCGGVWPVSIPSACRGHVLSGEPCGPPGSRSRDVWLRTRHGQGLRRPGGSIVQAEQCHVVTGRLPAGLENACTLTGTSSLCHSLRGGSVLGARGPAPQGWSLTASCEASPPEAQCWPGVGGGGGGCACSAVSEAHTLGCGRRGLHLLLVPATRRGGGGCRCRQ